MFSSKFINFYQGVPSEEEQKEIEKSFKRKFTGSENAGGIVIGFNNDPAKAPTVDDLSNTELDKHFDILNKTIQQEIFAGHQITSPMLFGIRVEGQLGGHSEMMDSYEVFKATYVNDKQQALERLFTDVFGREMKITPVEPVGFRLSEQALLQIAPKEWLLEKAGIDVSKYPSAVQPQATAQPTEQMVNEAIRGLSGRQYQQLMRIVREYSKGKLTLEAARALMRTGYNLQDEDINVLLGVHEDSEQQFNDDIDEILVAEFSKVGESKDEYSIIKSVPKYKFAEDITILQASVLDLIQKDKRITPEVIAEVLDIDKARVNEIIETLIKTGIISAAITKIGEDVIIEREVKKPLSSLTTERPEITQFKVMYSYEGPQDSRNRPFCAKMMRLNRLYSRSDIEGISRRFGYSVWDRRGGWWTKPSGMRSPSCRHKWVANLVTKKK